MTKLHDFMHRTSFRDLMLMDKISLCLCTLTGKPGHAQRADADFSELHECPVTTKLPRLQSVRVVYLLKLFAFTVALWSKVTDVYQ